MGTKKIAIVIGHNSKAQGAVRITDERTEFDWNGELASIIEEHDPCGVKVFRRERGGGYSREIDRVYAEVDAWGADCSLELHFNSSANARANGGLTLSSGSTGSLALANLVRERVAKVLNNTDRGVEVRGRHARGGRSLWQGRSPAIMTEPYFGSNPKECNNALMFMDEMAEAYYRAAMVFLS
jgi:N-acetylmuramoyl-L-alanine amidase